MSGNSPKSNPIRVGLMGFGRIGRNLYRLATQTKDIEIPVISDVGQPDILHYLLQKDTIHGAFKHDVNFEDNNLILEDGRSTAMIMGVAPGDVPWNDYKVHLIIDATGKYLTKAHMAAHLAAGAPRVIVTNLPDESIDRIVVIGLNEGSISAKDRMISAGSSTTNPVALMLKILDDAFGVEQAMMTTVHAYTADQPLADTAGKNFRRSRSAAENIIPNETPTAKWLHAILPQFKGKFDGIALNVPVPDGSCVDLTCRIQDAETTVEAINDALRTAALKMPNIIEATDDPIVSSDVIHNRHSLVIDLKATMKTKGKLIKTLGWYDNGWGHAARLIDLIHAYAQFNDKGGAA
ncbi:MAG: glyceraldehyde-3-phosphate dehydrogenase [Fidelibacterota bacterium]|nr:MAG: glyceraldehyde-3-phosphate dehydrogenase [Candidatus Neomarinimicrobiota bacterium]